MRPPQRPLYYRLEGRVAVPTDLTGWAEFFENADRIVAVTEIGLAAVSTVFVGVDMALFPDAAPLVFESLIFGGARDRETRRYSTWEEAERGHAELVAALRVAAVN